MLRKYYPQVNEKGFIPWRVYTEKDLMLYKLHKSSLSTGNKKNHIAPNIFLHY